MLRTTRVQRRFAWKPAAFGGGLILGLSVAYYRTHLSDVPLTGRKRFGFGVSAVCCCAD
jgi:hypothetical protein